MKKNSTQFFSMLNNMFKRSGYSNYKKLLLRLVSVVKENEILKKNLQSEISKYEQNYNNIFINSGLLFLSIDKNLKIIEKKIPPRYVDFFPEINKLTNNPNFLDLFNEREKQYFKDTIEIAFSGKNCSEELVRIQDNNQVWLNFTFNPFFDDNGNVYVVAVLISDITNQKKLEQNDKLLNAYENATSDNIFLLNSMGTFTEVRTSDSSTLPLSKEKIIGKTLMEVLPKDFAENASQALQRSLIDNDVKKIQYEINIQGVNRYFEATFSPVNEDEVLAIVTDQTEEIQKKKIIKEKDDWFGTIFNTSRDGLVVELNEKITIVNDAFVKLYGYDSQDELLGKKISIIHSEETDMMMLDYGKRRLRGEHVPSVYEAQGKRKNGEIIDIEITASVFEVQKQKYIVATNRNITERKNIERQILEQNDELQKINSELDKFVYSASHDLRAPLRSLLGLIYLFRIDRDDAKRDEYLDKMEKSVNNLDKFIQDIIQYSRNSRLEVIKEDLSLTVIISEAIEDLKYQVPNDKYIKIIPEVEKDLIINSDKYRFEVVINNLISNSLRYFDPEKKNSFVKIKAWQEATEVVVIVEDNGIGIGAEHIENIFKMFYRAHDKKVGTGLGLYIVKETVKMLKGTIDVSSKLAVGTKFTLRLPK